jgi:glucose-fructose oxidoreductase
MNPLNQLSRRKFLGQMSVATAAALTLPRVMRGAAEPETQKKLGVALVGLGSYSTNQLGPGLRETRHCRLAGVVTGSRAKGQKWAREYGFPERSIYSYDNMAEMAHNPDIDIVYVVTPNALHADEVVAAAQAGKHVISEKPFTTTASEAERAIAACRAAKVKLSIGYRLHFDPYHQELMRLGKDHEFGGFKTGRGDFGFTMGHKVWRAEKKLAGGGLLMDLGVYLIQGACMAAGGIAPSSVTAKEGAKTRPEIFTDVEENIEFTLEFPNGFSFHGDTSYSRNANYIRAEGAKRFIEIKPAFGYSGLAAETERGVLKYPLPVSHQTLQMDDFALCIREGRESRVSGEMGLRDMKIIDAIYEAARTGQRVAIRA